MLRKAFSIFTCIILVFNITALAKMPQSNKNDLKTLGIAYGKGHITAKASKTILIGVIDTGISNSYKDYNRFINKKEIPGNGIDDDNNGYVDDYSGYNFDEGCTRYNDTSLSNDITQHGTSVASIIAGKGNINKGIAPNVQILDLTWTWQLDRVINYANMMGCDIINISQKIFNEQCTPELTSAIKNFKGLIVIAGGNDGRNINGLDYNQLTYMNFPNVVTVGALNNNNRGIAWYSTYNKKKIDVCIKGEYTGLVYKNKKWKTERFMGTSCAAPIVTGMATLYKTKHKTANGIAMKKALINATTKKGYTKKFHYGRLDVKKLLKK